MSNIDRQIADIRRRAGLENKTRKILMKSNIISISAKPSKSQQILIKSGVRLDVIALAMGQLSPQTLKAFELFSRSR